MMQPPILANVLGVASGAASELPTCKPYCETKTHGFPELCNWKGCGGCQECQPEEPTYVNSSGGTWARHQQKNCPEGQGTSINFDKGVLGWQAAGGVHTLEECQAACIQESRCDAVLVLANSDEIRCYRKGGIDLEACRFNVKWDLYLLTTRPPPSPPAAPLALPPTLPPVLPPPAPPPPTPPSPPLAPSTPPTLTGMLPSTVEPMQAAIDEAIRESRNASFLLSRGKHLRLSSPLVCKEAILLSVRGGGADATLDGSGSSHIFDLSGGCSLSLRRLHIVNGGGAIRAENAGNIDIAEVTFENCSAHRGGAVYASLYGVLSMTRVAFVGCTAEEAGGAIYVRHSRDISLRETTFTRCSALRSGGGAMCVYNSGEVRLSRCTFSDCSARGKEGRGGALYSSGATVLTSHTQASNLIVADSVFTGCSARLGGAIALSSGATLHLTSSSVSACEAWGFGGGLLSEGGSMTLSNGTLISGCIAPEGGGSSLFLLAGEVSYVLPAPPGRWLPNALCEVYRAACVLPSSDERNACFEHRDSCSLTHNPPSEWSCPDPTFVQPCNWDSTKGGDPSRLGQRLYQLPLLPVDQDFPFACASGLHGSTAPKDQSSSACGGACVAGTASVEGSSSCVACSPGTHSANRGQGECIPCPKPLSSGRGSATCDVCMEGYYMAKASTADPATEHCRPCPLRANCSAFNTTLASLGVAPGYWRASTATARLYTCDGSGTCVGSTPVNDTPAGRALASRDEESGPYCAEGHTGPLCQVCSEGGQYFSPTDRHCVDCPGHWRLAVLAVAVALAAGIVATSVASLRSNWEPKRECLKGLLRKSRFAARLAERAGLWTKLKIAISFYQCVAAIPSIYVLTDSHLGGMIDDLLGGLTAAFRFVDLAVPSGCYGSKLQQLIGAAFTPYALFLLLALEQAIQVAVTAHPRGPNGPIDSASAGLRSALPAGLFLSFLLLPSISSLIFSSFLCDAFVYDDATGATRSYLQADYSVECETPSHRRLERWAYGLIPLWPAGVPALYLAFLLACRRTIRAGRVTHASASVRFLWADYRSKVFLWEVLEVLRKLTVTSFVILIDEQHAQARVLVALLVSILFLSLETWVQPFRRRTDSMLARMSNVALVVAYLATLVFKVCDRDSEACDEFGFSPEGIFTFFVLFGLTLLVLHFALAFTHLMCHAAASSPALRLVSTGDPPLLSMPEEVHFHLFVSHVWKTGQDQTHTLVRQLQLMLPGIRIWLDAVNLEDIGKLEEAVADAAVVLFFLSSGYFASRNCRREVYARNRPIEAAIEADKDKGGATVEEMQAEIRRCSAAQAIGIPSADAVIARVFARDPVPWLRLHDYQVVSLKEIALRVLRHLPYYVSNPGGLDRGLALPGELPPFRFPPPGITVLVCDANVGAREVAEEIRATTIADRSNSAGTVMVDDVGAVFAAGAAPPPGAVALLVYLNESAFTDAGGVLAATLRRAMDAGVPIALVHELDEERGACVFARYFDQAPDVLQQPPYKLFDRMAVYLYPSAGHRKISLRHVMRDLGAEPVAKAHLFARLSRAITSSGGGSLGEFPGRGYRERMRHHLCACCPGASRS